MSIVDRVEGGPNGKRLSYSPPVQSKPQGSAAAYSSARGELGALGNRQLTEMFQSQVVARGIQRYRAEDTAKSGPGAKGPDMSLRNWNFIEPIATLFDEAGNEVGDHYMNDEPRTVAWRNKADGSVVLGEKVKPVPSPTGAIPWIRLKAMGHIGNGAFSQIMRIDRVETVGGQPPPDASITVEDVRNQKTIDVPYEARYRFSGVA